MSVKDNIKRKIEKLIERINRRTGEGDTNLTRGVERLIIGYGSGNGDAVFYDGLIEIDGEPAKDTTDFVAEAREAGYAEGGAARENELKGDVYGIFEAIGVELPCNPTINDSFGEIREGIADALERNEKYKVLYWTAKDGAIDDVLVYEYRSIKTISAPVFATIGGEGLRGSCYRIELLAGCQVMYLYGGEVLELYDKLGSLTKQYLEENYIEVRNLYSDAEGESKISQDEQGFVWYVDDDVVYLCDYRGKSKDVILPESYKGREYGFWAGAMCDLRYERLYIPNSIKSFGGGFTRENVFSHKIRLVTDSIDFWFDMEYSYSQSSPFNIGKNCYINVNGEDVIELTTPNGRSEIKQYVFYNYKNLKNLTIGKDVTVIKTNAFGNCTSLTDVVINGNLTALGYAFVGCTALTNITVNGTLKATDNSFSFSASNNLTVESMVSIMNAFLDNTGSTQRTVYFGSTNLAKLTAAQKAIAIDKNLKLA